MSSPAPQFRLPIRVLCVAIPPSGLSPFHEDRAWERLSSPLGPYIERGEALLMRTPRLTEEGLRSSIVEGHFDIVWIIGFATERSANYGSLTMRASDGAVRQVAAAAAANLLCEQTGVALVVLQAHADGDFHFGPVAHAIAARGLAVVCTPKLGPPAQQALVDKLFSGILAGLPAAAVAGEIAAIRSDSGSRPALLAPQPGQPILLPVTVAPAVSGTPPNLAVPQPLIAPASAIAPQVPPPSWHEKLASKRATGLFDVFLCHNSADKPSVLRLGQQLKEAGILPWLDRWELQPGQPWQRALERQIGNIRAAAVFVGSAGLGPWQEQEIDGFLREFVGRRVPVIPILLPDAPATPELPVFLRAMTWVDFRSTDPDPFAQLLWGITGERPDD